MRFGLNLFVSYHQNCFFSCSERFLQHTSCLNNSEPSSLLFTNTFVWNILHDRLQIVTITLGQRKERRVMPVLIMKHALIWWMHLDWTCHVAFHMKSLKKKVYEMLSLATILSHKHASCFLILFHVIQNTWQTWRLLPEWWQVITHCGKPTQCQHWHTSTSCSSGSFATAPAFSLEQRFTVVLGHIC